MVGSALRLRAPAKLNLFLRVGGRRPDGFHELETLFERIDLYDELTFDLRPAGIELACDDALLDCGPGNLIVRAAALLQQAAATARGVAIRLTKRIPVAAGLGGGSSDAAAALVGLTRLWDLRLSNGRLAALAAELGSDVPFFLSGSAYAIGRGRGERIEPVSSTLSLWHVLVVPDATISTKEVYESLDRHRAAGSPETRLTSLSTSTTILAHALRNGSLGELAKGLANDLEPEAIRRCPSIRDIQQNLRQLGCAGCLVSGSGSSVFGLFPHSAQADEAAQRLRRSAPPGWRIEVVRTLH